MSSTNNTNRFCSTHFQDHGLEVYGGQNSAMNIGIMLLRSSAHDFCKAWSDKIDSDEKIWDQNAFNNLVRSGTTLHAEQCFFFKKNIHY